MCKQDTASALLDMSSPNITTGTDTWLTPYHQNSELDFTHSYTISLNDQTTSREGGVVIAICNTLLSKCIVAERDLKMLWCCVKTRRSYLLIGVCYRPPGTSPDFFYLLNELVLTVTNRYLNSEPALAGTFNYPSIEWVNYSTPSECQNMNQCNRFINFIQSLGLSQIAALPTRRTAILDIFFLFTSHPESIWVRHTLEEISDRRSALIGANVSTKKQQGTKTIFTNYTKAHICKLTALLDVLSREFLLLFDLRTVDANWEILKTKLIN